MKVVKKNTRNDPIKVCSRCFDVLPIDYKVDKSRSYICVLCKSNVNHDNHVARYPIKRTRIIERVSSYYYNNIEDCLRRVKTYRNNNRKKILEKSNARRKVRTSEDPTYRLKCRFSKYFWQCLKGNKGKDTKGILQSLGYTIEQARLYIESLWSPGMTWTNYGIGYGNWQIDHIMAVALFSFDSYYHPEFKKCWALTNLRPLWYEAHKAKTKDDLKLIKSKNKKSGKLILESVI